MPTPNPGRRPKRQPEHVRRLFAAGCSLRGVLADRRITKLAVAQACGLEPYYVSAAVNHAGTPAARRLGQDNLRRIYAAAGKLLGVPPGTIPEHYGLAPRPRQT